MDGAAGRRVHRFRGVEEKRRIVEETLRDGPRSRRLRVRTASTPTRCFSGAGFIETVFWMLLRVEERCGCCRLPESLDDPEETRTSLINTQGL
jgi:hypothetical protein